MFSQVVPALAYTWYSLSSPVPWTQCPEAGGGCVEAGGARHRGQYNHSSALLATLLRARHRHALAQLDTAATFWTRVIRQEGEEVNTVTIAAAVTVWSLVLAAALGRRAWVRRLQGGCQLMVASLAAALLAHRLASCSCSWSAAASVLGPDWSQVWEVTTWTSAAALAVVRDRP